MAVPRRIKDYNGRFGLVDGIPYTMPINGANSDVIMAGFTCDFEVAISLMPDRTLHPVRVSKDKAVFMVTIVDYRETDIGKYIEYSLALACHRGRKPGWPKLPAVFMNWYKTGQFILDLPVSTEVSVKGGKSIWGMPKHLANLDYINTDKMVTAQYEKDGQFAFRVEFEKPVKTHLKIKMGARN
jgi:Acetoacetate decarboxylase (ADC)